MPYKKRLCARFPPARIKKIMQMDEEVGKVSQSVPVMVSRALERFLEYIMTTTAEITASKDAKTLTSQHILEVVTRDSRLNFLKEATLKSCSLVSSNNGVYAGGGADGEANMAASNSKKTAGSKSMSDFSKQSDENEDDDSDDFE